MTSRSLLFVAMLLTLLLGACTPATATPATDATPAAVATTAGDNTPVAAPTTPIRIALLPITDAIPFYVAQQEGYFAEEGVTVELIPVASAPDRDILLQSNGAEAVLSDLVSTISVNGGEGAKLTIVRQLRTAYTDEPMFYLVSGPNSGIATVADLAGKEIAISENSIIEYYVDRLLTAEGLTADQIVKTAVPQLPVRLQLLMEGQIPAAVLPDPLASLAILQGATLVTSDAAKPEISQSVLSFNSETVATRRDDVAAVVRAYDRATQAINANASAYQEVLLANTSVPEPLRDQYTLPQFPVRELPTQAQFDDVVAWAMDKGLIKATQSYDTVVDQGFTSPE